MGTRTKYSVAAFFATVSVGVLLNGAAGSDKTASTNTAVAVGLRTARSGACSAPLKDGTVLITGGQGDHGPMEGTEVFGAKRGSTDAPAMAQSRTDHACAALPDGRVLVAGGTTLGGGSLNTAEIFDPATGKWADAPPMSSARSGAAAAMLPKGRVLIAGGESNGFATATLEIFDPATNAFTPVSGTLSSPRMQHASVALADGRVLIVGGTDGKNSLDTIDVFDPAAGSVSPLPRKLSAPRAGLTATLLLDGGVYIAGGSDGKQELASADLYDPKTGAITPAAPMSVPRKGHLAIRVPNNNTILITGGDNRGGAVAASEIYIPWWNAYKPFGAPGQQRAAASVHGRTGIRMADATTTTPTVTDSTTPVLPTLTTDKTDYSPGETATITGAGWPATTDPANPVAVTLTLTRSPQTSPDTTWTATTDASGNFTTTYLVLDTDAGVTFTLTASVGTDATAQIQTLTFTDSTHIHGVDLKTGQSPSPVPAGNSASYVYTVTFNSTGASGNSCTVQMSITTTNTETGLPAGATPSFSPAQLTNSGAGTVDTALTISTTSAVTPGTYTFTVLATGTGGDCDSSSHRQQTSQTLVVSVPETSPITVATVPAQLSISVDGGSAVTAPQTFNWVIGSTHTITTTSPQSGGTGKQYVWTSWSDAGSMSHSITVPSSATTYTANFKTQWELTLATTAGVPSGATNISGGTSGTFYDDGTTLSLSATTPVADGAGKRWVFQNWTGDVASAPNAANPVSVTMGQARTITANYALQWQLTLAVTAGVPGGTANISGGTNGSFYNDGTVLSLTAATPVADGSGKQWAFKNWTGDVSSPPNAGNPVSVTMSAARSVTANYGVQWQLTLSITAGVPGGTANISGGTNANFYDDGTVLSLKAATPVADGSGKQWAFKNWTGDVSSPPNSGNPVSLTMSGARSVTANYAVQWQLTLGITAGVPGGTANISGGTNGSYYDDGTVLSLTAATPVADGAGKQWAFKSWTGDVASPPNTSNPVSITMSAARSVTANYGVQWQLTLALTAGVPGGTAANISGGANGVFYDDGTVLNLTAATPVADGVGKQWVFKDWTGDVASPLSSVSVTMNQARSITANYRAQYKLTLAITAGVPNSLSNITGGTSGSFYDDTTVLSLSAVATVADGSDKQWVFRNWTGDLPGSPNANNPVSVTMDQPRTITANYGAQYKLTLAITSGVPNGLSNITGGATGTFYDDGTTLSLAAITPVADGPGKQWGFKSWTGDVPGSPNGANPISLTMSQARSVMANYVVQWQLTLSITSGVPGGLSSNVTGGSNGVFYDAGTVLNLGAVTPVADGAGKQWVFTMWTGDVPGPPNSSNPVSVTMNQPRSIGANYKVQYLLTISVSPLTVGRANVSPNPDQWYDAGTIVALAATTPIIAGSTSYTFDHWSGDATGTSNLGSVTMSGPKSVTANYNTWALVWDAGSAFSAQYSDPTGLRADLTLNGVAASGVAIHFSVGSDASSPDPTTTSGVATDTTTLTQAPGTSYTASAKCTACGGLTITHAYTITQEDARAIYTGPLFVSTSSPSSTAFTMLLTATIQDITAVDPSQSPPKPDNYPGDIRNAVARFVDRNNGNTLCTAPIGLVNPADTKTGTISCTFSGDVGSTSSAQYAVGIIVDDYLNQKSYYIRNDSADDEVVTVSQAIPGMITGGGYLKMYDPTKSAGQYAGTANMKTNFGFNVKYSKTGKNLQGNLNFIIRSGGRVYQIKSNSMSTLSLTQTGCPSTSPCHALFTSKANLTDITDPNNTVSLGGNLNLIASMTDNGEPGNADTFAITLYDSANNLLFSSNWSGTATVEQLLGGGNVVVH